jgi:sugar phosphate isomerase/epimerase
MQLAFSTNAFTRFSLSQALAAIKECGYSGVEILADAPHAYPDQLDEKRIAAIADEVQRLGLRVSNINANCTFGYWTDAPPEPFFEPSLISPNPKYRQDRTRMIFKAMDLAAATGARCLSITSGRLLGGMPPQAAQRQFEQSMLPILQRAESLNINVGIEYEPGLYIESAQELAEWIDRLRSPRLGANLDVGHCQVIGESIPDTIDLLAGRIWNLHVEDIPGRKHYHLIPGQGTMDWAALKTALAKVNYQGFLTVELYTYSDEPHPAARQSIAFLQQHFAA